MRWARFAWSAWADYAFAARWEFDSLFARRVPARWAAGGLAPVLLLPGVYESWHFLRVIGDRLNASGHPVHVAPDLRYNRASIPDAAALAQRYLDARDLRHVALVAHSKSGLIGKHMMALDDTDGRIASLVAIATPFAGSRLARFTPVRTLRAFLPTDETITTLSANLALNSRITSVYGRFDPHIPGGSALEGAVNVELPVLGHFRLLADERVIRAVLDAVGRQGN